MGTEIQEVSGAVEGMKLTERCDAPPALLQKQCFSTGSDRGTGKPHPNGSLENRKFDHRPQWSCSDSDHVAPQRAPIRYILRPYTYCISSKKFSSVFYINSLH